MFVLTKTFNAMKKPLSLLFAGAMMVALGVGCEKDDPVKLHDDYFYSDGVKYPLTAIDTKYYMIFKTADKQAVIDALTARAANFDATEIYDYNRYPYRYELIDENTPELLDCSEWIVDAGKSLSYEMIPELIYLSHYYHETDYVKSEMGVTNLLEVRPVGVDGLAKLESLAEKYRFLILGKDTQDQSLYRVACTKQTKGNALEMANLIYEKLGFYATPDFLVIIVSLKTNQL